MRGEVVRTGFEGLMMNCRNQNTKKTRDATNMTSFTLLNVRRDVKRVNE